MKLRTNAFDLWVFHRQDRSPEYLLYHTSQEKADKWFHGGRFWQIPGGFVQEEEELTDAFVRVMAESGLKPLVVWVAEHTYTYYNPRRKNIEIVPVFAAEVAGPKDVPISWEHSESGWFTAAECAKRLFFRGLIDGLESTRKYISEVADAPNNLQIL